MGLFDLRLSLCSLGSGSKGNCTWVGLGGGAVLVDAGLSARRTVARCKAAGLDPSQLRAILITHEHGDHIGGARALADRFEIPIRSTIGTARKVGLHQHPRWSPFTAGDRFHIGNLQVDPFSSSHDAADPVWFRLGWGDQAVAVATDMGAARPSMVRQLRRCQVVLLEFNHDLDQLERSSYPRFLKRRIRSRVGHLSNDQGGAILEGLLGGATRSVVLGHLSEKTNTPELARAAAWRVLEGAPRGTALPSIQVASQMEPGPVLSCS